MAQLAPMSSFPALFPSYIAQQEEKLVFKGRQFGSSYDISTVQGRALFAVEPVPSLGRRMRVLDASGKNIFCTRKETFHLGGNRYFIEKPSRPENAKGYFSTEGMSTDGAEGPVVALVEGKIIKLRKEYQVVVAQGVDAALIAGLIICLGEQEKSHSNAPAVDVGVRSIHTELGFTDFRSGSEWSRKTYGPVYQIPAVERSKSSLVARKEKKDRMESLSG